MAVGSRLRAHDAGDGARNITDILLNPVVGLVLATERVAVLRSGRSDVSYADCRSGAAGAVQLRRRAASRGLHQLLGVKRRVPATRGTGPLHLAAVQRTGPIGVTMVTADLRQAQAARSLGWPVLGA